MTREQIFISGARYSSDALHQDNVWRSVKRLAAAAHGSYTAVVDGKHGVITIDASGWWFTETGDDRAKVKSPDQSDENAIARGEHALDLKGRADHLAALLEEWLAFDHWENEKGALTSLVLRTRVAVAETRSLSPAKASAELEVCHAP